MQNLQKFRGMQIQPTKFWHLLFRNDYFEIASWRIINKGISVIKDCNIYDSDSENKYNKERDKIKEKLLKIPEF